MALVDQHSLAIQSLYLSQFFSEEKTPSDSDLVRLSFGLEFIAKMMAAELYFSAGETNGLQASDVSEARKMRNALSSELIRIASVPDVRSALTKIQGALEEVQAGNQISQQERSILELLFGKLGKLILSEAMDAEEHVVEELDDDRIAV